MGGRFGDLLVILIVAILLFGPKKIPDLARNLGEAIREFKKAANTDPTEKPETAAVAAPAPQSPAPAARAAKAPKKRSRSAVS